MARETSHKDMGDLILFTVSKLPENHPKRVFYEWFMQHARDRNLEEAIAALGLPPVEEGGDLVMRIEEAVMPILMKGREWHEEDTDAV